MNNKKLGLSTALILGILVGTSAIASLPQLVSGFSWPCLDKTEGKAPMTSSGNNLYVAWWGNGTGNFEVMFKASNDSGQTFEDKINLSNSTNGTSIGADVAASGNNVYVTYWDNKTGTGRVYIKTSEDNGKSWTPEVSLTDTPSNVAPYPQTKEGLAKLTPYELKIAAAGNNVYVVANGAESLNNITSPSDIFIKASNDNGKTFGESINLSNSTGVKSTRAIVEASGDNVSVSWWDTANGKDIPMIRTSTDGGQTFDKAIVLTANSTQAS